MEVERKYKDNLTDQIIKCVDCGGNFVLTSGEIQFFQDRKLNLPKRCSECRRKRREGRASEL
jgi:hypothetical protein